MTDEPDVDKLVRQATDLAREAPQPLRRVKVQTEGAAVEMEWSEPAAAAAPEGTVLTRVDLADAAGAAEVPATPATPATLATPVTTDADERHRVSAPLVGTFYQAPEPGAPPFVRVGDVVEPGQQVGIIEAMKLMNPIESDRRGRVAEVLVDDSTPVQFDDALIVLDPEEDP